MYKKIFLTLVCRKDQSLICDTDDAAGNEALV